MVPGGGQVETTGRLDFDQLAAGSDEQVVELGDTGRFVDGDGSHGVVVNEPVGLAGVGVDGEAHFGPCCGDVEGTTPAGGGADDAVVLPAGYSGVGIH